jgi:toxin FitB
VIVLDTNVISELMRPLPSRKVVAFLSKYERENVFISSLTVMELWYGVYLLPTASEQSALEQRVSILVENDFGKQLLTFGKKEARACARLLAVQRRRGHMLKYADTQIAATALASGFAVVTRNVGDFAVDGLEVVNPWTA